MSAPALWKALLWVFKAIGGWLIPELKHEGALGVVAILRCGARKIRGKRKRATSERRKNWLMARERRWVRAARRVMKYADSLSRSAVRGLEKYSASQGVPWHSPQESYRG